MQTVTLSKEKSFSFSQLMSGTLMVAGTTIGAGMLGMPLLTAKAGFWPAVGITFLVWAFMLSTGLLLLEVCLRMPSGSNILSLAEHFLGKKGKSAVGALFAFLYYCLLVAYFAAGSLFLLYFLSNTLGIEIGAKGSLCLFSVIFGLIVASGAKSIDKVNQALTIAMLATYALLIGLGGSAVQMTRLANVDISVSLFATPVLFSAFGYHNIIPSLTGYLRKEKKVLRLSILFGTLIALFIFLLWQWLIIGSIPADTLAETLSKGLPVTQALQEVVGRPEVFRLGQFFAFFALTTSLLGVCFSMVDFLGEALKVASRGKMRLVLTLLTFLPPILCVLWDPTIFDRALGLAGGIGEAFLNGLVPLVLFYLCAKRNPDERLLESCCKKVFLCSLLVFCSTVVFVEIRELLF